MILEKILNKIADKYYSEHKEQLENKFNYYLNSYAKNTIEDETRFLPHRMVDNFYQSKLEQIVDEIVRDKINERNEAIKKGLNPMFIYEQAERVLNERIDEIIEHDYKQKINEVVNEIIDNLKNK